MDEYISRQAFKEKYLCCGWLPEMAETEFDDFPAADVVEVNAHDRMTVEIPCRIGDPVWIIANRGGVEFVRPARVVRIEIDADLKPVIYTKGGFGLWGDKVFPDAESAMQELERRKHK